MRKSLNHLIWKHMRPETESDQIVFAPWNQTEDKIHIYYPCSLISNIVDWYD